MANHLFPKGRQKFLEGGVAWLSDTIKVTAVTSAYVQSDAHEFISSVGAGSRVVTSGALTSKTSTNGSADAADVVYAAVPGGSTIVGLVVWKDTGVEATSPVLAWYDTKADTTPISVPTNGGDITVAWAAGGLFTL